MKIEIRRAVSDDISVLTDISVRTIAAEYCSFLGKAAVDAYLKSGMVEQYVEGCVADCIVITGDKQPVGFCVCKQQLIDLMMIDQVYHRMGLGTKLLQHCERVLFARYGEIRLESFAGNDKANRFYRKNGWHESEVLFDPASGSEKIIFYKKAKPSIFKR